MCIIKNSPRDIFLYVRPFSVRSTTFFMHDLKSYAYYIIFFVFFCLICSFFLYDESAPGVVSTYRGIFAAVATNRNGIITKNRRRLFASIWYVRTHAYIESSGLDSVPGSLSPSPVYDSRLRLNSTFCLPCLTFFKCCYLCFADKKYAHLLSEEAWINFAN